MEPDSSKNVHGLWLIMSPFQFWYIVRISVKIVWIIPDYIFYVRTVKNSSTSGKIIIDDSGEHLMTFVKIRD